MEIVFVLMFSVSVSTCELCLPLCVYSALCVCVCVDVCPCVFSLASWIALSHHMLLILSAAQTVFFWRRCDFFCSSSTSKPCHALSRTILFPLSPSRLSSFVSVVSALAEKHTQMSLNSFHLTLQKISFLISHF